MVGDRRLPELELFGERPYRHAGGAFAEHADKIVAAPLAHRLVTLRTQLLLAAFHPRRTFVGALLFLFPHRHWSIYHRAAPSEKRLCVYCLLRRVERLQYPTHVTDECDGAAQIKARVLPLLARLRKVFHTDAPRAHTVRRALLAGKKIVGALVR